LQKEKIENLNFVTFKLSEINKTEKADLKDDLFKKVYKDDTPKNASEFKKRIKNEIEDQFVNQSDQKFLNDVTDEFIKVSKIKFPEEFVKKLIKANSKEELSDEQVQNEFDNSINGLKYQLIEAKLLEENNIIINHEMLNEFAEKSIRNQMMAYGQLEPSKKDIDSITARIFSNEEEVKRMTHQLISEKLLVLYKEKVNKKITEIFYEKYIELAYNKND
jgi:trigger factor